MSKKEFIIKLRSPMDLSYENLHIDRTSDVDNYQYICDFDRKNYYKLGPYKYETPCLKYVNCRPYIDGKKENEILFHQKKDFLNEVQEHYDDRGFQLFKIYYSGNFNNPVIHNNICDTAKITIVGVKEGEALCKEITRYLNVELFKSPQ